jgi:AraC family transcriptional regulator of adaptative response / DNA-3-methyladenine glycosylase II
MKQLDEDICYNALVARDRRFDGRFYTAVLTTGVFCRPICPAITPKRRNVRFFPTAEAAIAHGFRPCLRCRPEVTPGSPAAEGVHATVRRAVQLIEDGVLETGSSEDLAARLGIGARHLRRLFKEHTGVTPREHASARRLMRARQLLMDSNLSMSEIAEVAGFGSLRRFNDAMKTAYGHAPTAFRRGLRIHGVASVPASDPLTPRRDDLVLRLRARPPFDASYLLSFFRERAIPGLEQLGPDWYCRGFRLGDAVGLMVCRFDRNGKGVEVSLRGAVCQKILEICGRVRRLFDLDSDIGAITTLLADDPLLVPLIEKRPGLRVPGCWDRFELAVRAVLGQQVSVAAARTLAGRMVARYGEPLPDELVGDCAVTHLFPTTGILAGQDLQPIGLTRRRAQTLSGIVDLFAWPYAQDNAGESLLADLAAIPGIGPWTLEYFALRGLGEPDAFPATDLGLLKASARSGGPDKAKPLEEHSQRWRPWRAYAAQYLWSSLGDRW